MHSRDQTTAAQTELRPAWSHRPAAVLDRRPNLVRFFYELPLVQLWNGAFQTGGVVQCVSVAYRNPCSRVATLDTYCRTPVTKAGAPTVAGTLTALEMSLQNAVAEQCGSWSSRCNNRFADHNGNS